MNECLGSFSCHAQAQCVNVPGSYKCVCLPGYAGDGKSNCTLKSKLPEFSKCRASKFVLEFVMNERGKTYTTFQNHHDYIIMCIITLKDYMLPNLEIIGWKTKQVDSQNGTRLLTSSNLAVIAIF